MDAYKKYLKVKKAIKVYGAKVNAGRKQAALIAKDVRKELLKASKKADKIHR